MNVFESVRKDITARTAAEQCGIKVNWNGMACCPFHSDKHPSLKLDKRFHCFGCGADGDAIDFVSRFFGVNGGEAAKKLAADFAIEYEDKQKLKQELKQKPKKAVKPTIEQRTLKLEKQLKNWMEHAEKVLLRYQSWLEFWQRCYRPESVDEEWHPLFRESLDKKSQVDYYLSVLQDGSDVDRLDFSLT